MAPSIETSFHHGSHEGLLQPVEPGAAESGIDAIIVPTIRPPANLRQAFSLARDLECTLVTIHSGDSTKARDAVSTGPDDVDLVAIDIPPDALTGTGHVVPGLRLPRWETSDLLAGSVFERRTDLSLKRNLALVLSRLAGWSRVFFLDDDIIHVKPADVRRASGALGPLRAVGLRLDGTFHDHSVVCEAYRLLDGDQSDFVGGGALVVDPQVAVSHGAFFPDIYNDDWFFLLDGGKGILPTGITGKAIQIAHDLFGSPQRALDQELGDVLAEGLYWLLDQDQPVTDANLEHWSHFITIRGLFIRQVIRMVNSSTLPIDQREHMTAALRGARSRLDSIEPGFCDRYLQAWARDRESWRTHLSQLPAGVGRGAGLAELTQPGAPPLRWYARDPSRRAQA